MYFRFLHDDSSGAMSYLLGDLAAREALLIDPRSADLPVLTAMLLEHRLQLKWVLRTHQHDRDQPDEAEALKSFGAPIIAHATAVADGDLLPFGSEHVRVMATPGHTAGCLSFLWRDRLFCGDLLTIGACPYQPHPALPDALWDSVNRKIFTLPNETLLFYSHARHARAVSSILEQRCQHPWLAGATRDEFLSRVKIASAAPPVR